MDLTRQQQRKEKETSSAIEQNVPLEEMPSSEPAMSFSDRENAVTDQLRVNPPRESLSWSIGDHQGIRNQIQMQNSNQEITQAMKCIQDNVSNLEHSFQTVTELLGVIQSFNENHIMPNTQTAPQKRRNHPRNEVLGMRRSERKNRSS